MESREGVLRICLPLSVKDLVMVGKSLIRDLNSSALIVEMMW